MDRLLTEREFDEAWYRAEHDTVLDRKAAILKAQDAKTANYYETVINELKKAMVRNVTESESILVDNIRKGYETVIIPQKIKEAEKKLIEEIKGCGYQQFDRNGLATDNNKLATQRVYHVVSGDIKQWEKSRGIE
jgi:hypothetical protein